MSSVAAATSNECSGCWGNTNGACKTPSNNVCFELAEATGTCPPGTELCPAVALEPTTMAPTIAPITAAPIVPTTPAPVAPTTPIPTLPPVDSSQVLSNMIQSLDLTESRINGELLLYKNPSNQWELSNVYKYQDMRQSLLVMAIDGVAGKTFYAGESNQPNGHKYGLVNLAAFLAQSMKETIQYDACDENSWDRPNSVYPLSNACGQLNQSYQDYECSENEKHMECPLNPEMRITAVTNAKWYGAPGPLFCRPKTDEINGQSGRWNIGYECNKPWMNPPEVCTDYEGQKAGRYEHDIPTANSGGRTDVENCCWWGRGVIQTTGRCNFGKLNYFLGSKAADEGRPSRYPTINFCQDPEIICSSTEYKELKWVAGMFYWIESVQSYNVRGWDYNTELQNFVNGGYTDDSFINAVSGIVNRGCHDPPCGTGPVDGLSDRKSNFVKALDVFLNNDFDGTFAPVAVAVPPPPPTTPQPSLRPPSTPVPTTIITGELPSSNPTDSPSKRPTTSSPSSSPPSTAAPVLVVTPSPSLRPIITPAPVASPTATTEPSVSPVTDPPVLAPTTPEPSETPILVPVPTPNPVPATDPPTSNDSPAASTPNPTTVAPIAAPITSSPTTQQPDEAVPSSTAPVGSSPTTTQQPIGGDDGGSEDGDGDESTPTQSPSVVITNPPVVVAVVTDLPSVDMTSSPAQELMPPSDVGGESQNGVPLAAIENEDGAPTSLATKPFPLGLEFAILTFMVLMWMGIVPSGDRRSRKHN